MATVADTTVPGTVAVAFERTARRSACGVCYQCGTCTSSCPSGRQSLSRTAAAGPTSSSPVGRGRAQERRPSGAARSAGTCTRCPPDGHRRRRRAARPAPARARARRHPLRQRTAAAVATTHLKKRPRIDDMRFGAAMVSKGYVPEDKLGAAALGMKLARTSCFRAGAAAGRRSPAGRRADAAGLHGLHDSAGPRAVRGSARGGRRVRRPAGRVGGRRLLRPPKPRRGAQPVRDRRARHTGACPPATRASPRAASSGPALGPLTERADRSS